MNAMNVTSDGLLYFQINHPNTTQQQTCVTQIHKIFSSNLKSIFRSYDHHTKFAKNLDIYHKTKLHDFDWDLGPWVNK